MFGRTFSTLTATGLLLQTAAAQSIRGTVILAQTGEPLPFTVVMLSPGDGRIFTDAQGGFSFSNLGNGTYLLSVRQIGFSPVDTQVTLRGDDPSAVRIALHAGRSAASPRRDRLRAVYRTRSPQVH